MPSQKPMAGAKPQGVYRRTKNREEGPLCDQTVKDGLEVSGGRRELARNFWCRADAAAASVRARLPAARDVLPLLRGAEPRHAP